MYNTITPNNTERNFGSCRDLVQYLDKEQDLSRDFVNYLDKEQGEHFFNSYENSVHKEDVIYKIDNNCKKLSRDETRFYSLTFDPSKEEIECISKLAEKSAKTLCPNACEGVDTIKDAFIKEYMKEYTIKAMDNYACNFGRSGIQNSKDLVWFGRVEKDRYWKSTSYEVKHNQKILRQLSKPYISHIKAEKLRASLIKEKDVRIGGKDEIIMPMQKKSGINYHIHVIVSRKDVTQRVKLSPLAAARENSTHKVDGRNCKIGFDRNKFTNALERTFDNTFAYLRTIEHSYEYRKAVSKNLKGKSIITPEMSRASIEKHLKERFISKDFLALRAKVEKSYLEKNGYKPIDITQYRDVAKEPHINQPHKNYRSKTINLGGKAKLKVKIKEHALSSDVLKRAICITGKLSKAYIGLSGLSGMVPHAAIGKVINIAKGLGGNERGGYE